MNVTIDGVALDYATNDWSTFSMSFGLSGGTFEAAGCDSWVMNASVTDFHATFAAPTDFSANITHTPYPCGGPVYGGLYSQYLVLQSTGDIFAPGSTLTGTFGTMQIEEATWTTESQQQPASVPEPGSLTLILIGCAFMAYMIGRSGRIRYRPSASGTVRSAAHGSRSSDDQ